MSHRPVASDAAVTIDRREFSLGMVLAAVATLGGCALLRQESDIERALEELKAALQPLLASGPPGTGTLGATLRDPVRELAREHGDFSCGASTTWSLL